MSLMGKKNLINFFLKDLKKKQASNGKLRSTTLYMLVGPLWAPHQVPLPASHIGMELQRFGIFTPSYGTPTSLTGGELRST